MEGLTHKCSRSFREREITAILQCFDFGIQATVTGGDLSHVGAVCVADNNGIVQTIEFPKHKDAVIAKKWASKLYELTKTPVVVTAGVHYDNLSRDGIDKVLECCDELLEECSLLL